MQFKIDMGWIPIYGSWIFIMNSTLMLQQNHYRRTQVYIYLPIMDPKMVLWYVPHPSAFKKQLLCSQLLFCRKGKQILGLESSRKCALIPMHCTVEKFTNFGKAKPANHAKAWNTHPLPSRSDSWLPKQNIHQPDMNTIPPTNSKADSKTGKSNNNFVSFVGRFNIISKHKNAKNR